MIAFSVNSTPPAAGESLPSRDHIMPFEIKACSIDHMHQHPTLKGRTQARVKVMLREIRPHETFDHDLTLNVWADTRDDMSPDEIKTALLTRAATILKRTVTVAELPVETAGNTGKGTPSG
jgi:hypothetical protein